MIKHAIWVLEKEYEFLDKHTSWGPRGPPTLPRDAFWIFGGIVAGATQSAIISTMPYYTILRSSVWVDDFLLKQAQRASPIAFKFGAGIKGFQPVFRAAASRSTMLAARVGSRFIPYVGWALFAYDIYSVGRWSHRKLAGT